MTTAPLGAASTDRSLRRGQDESTRSMTRSVPRQGVANRVERHAPLEPRADKENVLVPPSIHEV